MNLKEHGYPILTMASRTAPYQTVLAPPPQFGIDWRRIGAIIARAASAAESTGSNLVGVGCVDLIDNEYTICYRSRMLEAAEVDPGPPEDRFSRPIRVHEGVIFTGRRSLDPNTALAVAQRQLSEAIKDFWVDSTRFEAPRFSDAVECAVGEAVSAGSTVGPDVTAASADEAVATNDAMSVSSPDEILLQDEPADSSELASAGQRMVDRVLIVLVVAGLLIVFIVTVLLVSVTIFR